MIDDPFVEPAHVRILYRKPRASRRRLERARRKRLRRTANDNSKENPMT
jgi:hypothetical protein